MTSPAARPRHLSSSPFSRPEEPVVEHYAVDDRVCHDTYGIGRVISTEAAAATVDFGDQKVRIVSPYAKMEKL